MTATREEVLAWMVAQTPPAGYKRAAKHFDLPVSTVATWGREAQGKGSRPRARARREELGMSEPAPKAPPAPPTKPPEWDPASQPYRDWLVERIRECLTARDVAMSQDPPHGGVARQWETSVGDYREKLERLDAEERAAEEAKGRSVTANASPEELARALVARVLRALPAVVAVVPAEVRGLRDEITKWLDR